MAGVCSTPSPGTFTPATKPIPIVQEVVLTPQPVWTDTTSLDPTVFEPKTIQLVASRYTDYSTPPKPQIFENISAYYQHTRSLYMPCFETNEFIKAPLTYRFL
jgi:hypothetical protein